MTVIKRFLRNFARIKSNTANDNDPGLAFSIEWSKHLITVLRRHRYDNVTQIRCFYLQKTLLIQQLYITKIA